MKNKYTATFQDGTQISRTTSRVYAVAWRATWTDDHGNKCVRTGFSADKQSAKPDQPAPWCTTLGNSRARAEAKKKNAEFRGRCGYSVEFADAIPA